MSRERRTVKNLNVERGRPVIPLSESHQSGQPDIPVVGYIDGPYESLLRPPSPPNCLCVHYQDAISRGAQWTQLIDSESDQQTRSTWRPTVTPLNLQPGRPVIPLAQGGQNRQPPTHLPMFQMDQSELRPVPPGSQPPAPVDVEVSDDGDYLIILSPTAFRQAISSSRSQRTPVTDVDSVEISPRNQRRRLDIDPQLPSGNFELHAEHVAPPPSPPPPPSPQPPPPVPTYYCPICLGPMVDETSTKCGHLFCDGCIRSAISTQAKCPMCRRKVNHRELLRVFFPAPI